MQTISIKVGEYVWLDCEVKPGAFSNERMVLLKSGDEEWLGFVPNFHLAPSTIQEGRCKIHALIVNIVPDKNEFYAKIPGESLGSSIYVGSLSQLQEYATI